MQVDQKVRTYLEGAGIGLTKGTNLFGPELAPEGGVPVNGVFITTAGGRAPMRAMGSSEVRSAIINVLVRWDSYAGGLSICLDIMDALQGADVSGTLYVESTESNPTYLARTEEGYHKWSLGFRVDYNA